MSSRTRRTTPWRVISMCASERDGMDWMTSTKAGVGAVGAADRRSRQ